MTPRAERWRLHAGAFALYALLAAIFIDHGEPLTRAIVGQGSDPFSFVWFLQWWPWALTHGVDPLFTRLIWQPAGVCIAWLTGVPLLSLLGWPLTLISPVLTYNLLILAGPVLAAFCAWALCLHLTGKPGAALIGGFLFGYSSYETAQATAVLNLSFIALVPLLLLIVLLRLEGRLSRPVAVFLAAAVLIAQFLICIEIFAQILIFGAIAWALALAYLPGWRPALRRLVTDGALAAPLVAAALLPLLVSMMKYSGTVNLPAAWPYYYVTDLTNVVIPSRLNLFGSGMFRLLSSRFPGGPQEQDGYLGVPLLLIVFLFAKQGRRRPEWRLLFVCFLLLLLASLGPRLWLAGHYTNFPLPWSAFVHLPLLHWALPARFALFVSLCVALMVALWLAGAPPPQRRARLALALLACFMLLPGFFPWRPVPELAFFQPGRVEAVLGLHARVLILPFAITGPSSYWQAENRFGFEQTGGYVGFPPTAMQHDPAMYAMFAGSEGPGFVNQLATFLAATHTQFIVAGPGTTAALRTMIAQLGWTARPVDDVIVYAAPGETLRSG